MPTRPRHCLLTGPRLAAAGIAAALARTGGASPGMSGATGDLSGGMDATASRAGPSSLDSIDAWLTLLVPPGFTPPAAALLILAVGLAIWLAGGRYLRVALAAAGGIAGAVLALRLLPPTGGEAVDWAPTGVAAILGAIGAAAARRLVATAGLAVALGLMAPAAVVAWDGMAAPHLTDDLAGADLAVVADPISPSPAAVLSRPETALALPAALAWGRPADDSGTLADDVSAAAIAGATDAARARIGEAARRLATRLRTLAEDGIGGAGGSGSDRATTLAALGVAGLVAGLGLGLTRSEFAARAATATIGAALVLLGGLHLPAGLAPGGWIGPTAPEPVLLAWIALSGLGATLQWSYRPRSADIGR